MKPQTVISLTIALLCSALLLMDKLFPPDLPDAKTSFASVVLDREGVPLRTFADERGIWRYYVSVEEVSPLYVEALLNYEDRYFYQHPGVNPVSLVRAGWQWLSSGRVISGGSTLTMQVARVLHPHERSLLGKTQQILRALQLEWRLSKTEILELYINYAPFGGTIEGVQAASFQYLNKSASKLRPSEAALLAVLPQAPSRLRPDRYPQRAQDNRNKVLRRLAKRGVWSRDRVNSAIEEQIAVWPLRVPVVAPLLSRRLKQENPQTRVIKTTLDRNLQLAFADTIKNYTAPLEEHISAAALLIENQSQEVLAYVGSADFQSIQRSGHVDMVSAIRSPGSTLKPLLFGLALDDHLIHSESLLADVPRFASGYRPGNFSGGFSGPISATEALQRSLNMPFVQLIEAYGEQGFANKLVHVGAGLKIPGGVANSAIVLGGAGSSLERLVTLYSGLGNQGVIKPISFTSSSKEQVGRRLFSMQAAWITWDVLRQIERPFQHRHSASVVGVPELGWKTGTSWGFRDVWAIGANRQYTLGVWLGRPDGKPMQKTTGRTLAGPLLFNLFDLLNHAEQNGLTKPPEIEKKTICWPDGREKNVESLGCDQTRLANTITGITPRTLNSQPSTNRLFYDPIHYHLENKSTGLRTSRGCEHEEVISRKVSLWPVALESWLPVDLRRIQKLPPYADGCKVVLNRSDDIRLVGIKEGQIYHAYNGGTVSMNIRAEGGGAQHEWYLNGELLEESSHTLTLKLTDAKEYELIVQNKSGALGRVRFKVL